MSIDLCVRLFLIIFIFLEPLKRPSGFAAALSKTASLVSSPRRNCQFPSSLTSSSFRQAMLLSTRNDVDTKFADPSNENSESSLLLQEWAHHSDASYHHFSPSEARAIRLALLTWYRQNRRKLPWRGDAPPFDGSTAGMNKTPKAGGNAKITGKQSNITSFFAASKKIKKNKEQKMEVLEEAIPVSGYGVWVSEIMLQQTRVEAVIPYWLKWMKSFPTVHALAAASEENVNAHWAGLGFYRRARLLHQGAKRVVEEHNGEIPQTVEGLMEISGIGRYTASAISSIAFEVCVPVVDGNVCRVLSRLTGIANHIKAPALKDKLGWDLATQIVEAGDGKYAGEVNQAIMELGATYCAPSGTGVDPRDPLKDFYRSTRLGQAYSSATSTDIKRIASLQRSSTTCELCSSDGIETILADFQANLRGKAISSEDAAKYGHSVFPLDPPKSKKREEDLAVAALSNTFNNETWWLLVKRPPSGLLAGQWEFPSVCVQTRNNTNVKTQPPKAQGRRTKLTKYLQDLCEDQEYTPDLKRKEVDPAPIEHIFSHVKHIMWVETCCSFEEIEILEWTTSENKQVRWMREKDMRDVGITSGVKKVLKAVKNHTVVNTAPKKKQKR